MGCLSVTAVKIVPLLASLVAAVILSPAQSPAAPVGKLAGTYKGGGTLLDKRMPMYVYKYVYTAAKVKVSSKGVIFGGCDVARFTSHNGGAFMPAGSSHLLIEGTATKIKVVKGKITAKATLNLYDGTDIDGTFSVNPKTGQGAFSAKNKSAEFEVSFSLKK